MAKTLSSPRELRAQAQEHREMALKMADSEQRRGHLCLAREYERLAHAIETEQAIPPSGGAKRDSCGQSATVCAMSNRRGYPWREPAGQLIRNLVVGFSSSKTNS